MRSFRPRARAASQIHPTGWMWLASRNTVREHPQMVTCPVMSAAVPPWPGSAPVADEIDTRCSQGDEELFKYAVRAEGQFHSGRVVSLAPCGALPGGGLHAESPYILIM